MCFEPSAVPHPIATAGDSIKPGRRLSPDSYRARRTLVIGRVIGPRKLAGPLCTTDGATATAEDLPQRIHGVAGLHPRARRRGLDRFMHAFIMNLKAYQNSDDVLAIRAIDVGGDTRCVLPISHFGLDR
jgi:hypothetical protein